MKFVAVGFKCKHDRSIFYFKTDELEHFIGKLQKAIAHHDPDFVSLRVVKE